jgi:7-cyano-7-deazaguanine synthase
MKKEIVVLHSGGMDSSICLYLAKKEFGHDKVLSLSFEYNQRHRCEIEAARHIAGEWHIETEVVDISGLITPWQGSALVDRGKKIAKEDDSPPSSFVVCRNGIFVHIAACFAKKYHAKILSLGLMQGADANSGYPDCSREYIDLMQSVLRLDLQDPTFQIRTPLIDSDKLRELEIAYKEGIFPFLYEKTISCYEGIPKSGCGRCPSCVLRNKGMKEFCLLHPEIIL